MRGRCTLPVLADSVSDVARGPPPFPYGDYRFTVMMGGSGPPQSSALWRMHHLEYDTTIRGARSQV